MKRRGLRRFLRRRRFYGQLPRIIVRRLTERDRRPAAFVALMGGLGDLVNFFPTAERLAGQCAVDLGTGPAPYATLAGANPHLRAVYSPFVYKPIRTAHRRLIERTLGPFYDRVILLDEPDSAWRTRGRHLSDVYAERCQCPAPGRGAVYLPERSRQRGAAVLEAMGVRDFVYVAQVIRASRPYRSWPLGHYDALYRALRARCDLTILVDTFGSDERALPEVCRPLEPLDILTAAAVIERARLFIGPDTGLTHVAAALGVPTVSIHLGYSPEICRALGANVRLVRQLEPMQDPGWTKPDDVLAAVNEALAAAS